MRVNILGVLIDRLTVSQAESESGQLLSDRGRYIVTPNPEFIVLAQQNKKFLEILNRSSLSVADGVGLVWASRLLGATLPERVAGIDLAEHLVALAAKGGRSVYLLGGRKNSAEKAAQKLTERYPGLKVVGTFEGESDESHDQETLTQIGKRRVDLLLVAFGHPKQEYWLDRNLSQLDIGLAMGIGGAFDYWSGHVARAPEWIRNLGLEWLYRLIRQPWRLKRQLSLPKFAALVFKEALLR